MKLTFTKDCELRTEDVREEDVDVAFSTRTFRAGAELEVSCTDVGLNWTFLDADNYYRIFDVPLDCFRLSEVEYDEDVMLKLVEHCGSYNALFRRLNCPGSDPSPDLQTIFRNYIVPDPYTYVKMMARHEQDRHAGEHHCFIVPCKG